MNNQAKNKADFEDQEQTEVFGLLSENLKMTPQSQAVLDTLEKRLESSIQISIAKHANLRTVRSKEGIWRNLVAGIHYKPLWESPQGNSVLVEFSPGSSLPIHRHNYLEEGIVLSGGLQLEELALTQYDYHVSPAASRHGRIRSSQGALAYLRGSSLGQPLSMFKEMLGGLLPNDHQESESIMNNESGWVEIQRGVCQKVLWTDGKVSSRFFRLEAGAQINGYDHPLDEECMLLSGDIFKGDILLQQGDYMLVPAGTGPLDIYSDTGALFFLRGAVQNTK
jgi:ChrR Cupin-like domain